MLKARPKGITRATLRQYYVQNQMSGATQTRMQKSGSVNVLLSNKPFPRCILLLFQTESWCPAFHTFKKKNLVSQTTNLICQTKNVQEKPISQRKVAHKYLLWNRGNSNSEMVYWLGVLSAPVLFISDPHSPSPVDKILYPQFPYLVHALLLGICLL